MSDVSWAGIGAAIGALLTGLFGWLVQKNKGRAEIEVTAVGEWQKLYTALSDRLAAVEGEFAAYRSKMADDMAERDRRHIAELKARDDQIAGLVRQIAQNSQSTVNLLSSSPVTHPKDGPDGK